MNSGKWFIVTNVLAILVILVLLISRVIISGILEKSFFYNETISLRLNCLGIIFAIGILIINLIVYFVKKR